MTQPRPTYTTEQAAELLGVPRAAIEKWKHRLQVTPADFIRGRGRGGLVPLYYLDDLTDLAAAYKARATRRDRSS